MAELKRATSSTAEVTTSSIGALHAGIGGERPVVWLMARMQKWSGTFASLT